MGIRDLFHKGVKVTEIDLSGTVIPLDRVEFEKTLREEWEPGQFVVDGKTGRVLIYTPYIPLFVDGEPYIDPNYEPKWIVTYF